MKGLGTLVDVLAILLAGGVGAIFQRRLSPFVRKLLLQIVGFAAIVMGAMGAWDAFFVLDGESFEMGGSILVILSLVAGSAIGWLLHAQDGLGWIGRLFGRLSEPVAPKNKPRENHRKRVAAPAVGDDGLIEVGAGSSFADGFVVASVLCAFNSFALSGAITEGTVGDANLLYIKAAIDAVLVAMLALIYGSGVAFASVSVLVIQGGVTLIGALWPAVFTADLTDQLSLIAAIMSIVAGGMLCVGKRMRAGDMIPSLFVPPLWILILKAITAYLGTAE